MPASFIYGIRNLPADYSGNKLMATLKSQAFRHRARSSVLFVCLLLYLQICRTLLRGINCNTFTQVGGYGEPTIEKSVLIADPATECYVGDHTTLAVFIWLVTAVAQVSPNLVFSCLASLLFRSGPAHLSHCLVCASVSGR
jgi:hypothetical protein